MLREDICICYSCALGGEVVYVWHVWMFKSSILGLAYALNFTYPMCR